jgi:hypothetical protein
LDFSFDHSFFIKRTTQIFHTSLLASLRLLLNMADINTAIPMPAQRVSSQLIRQDTFFDVTMSKKRHDRIVPVMAVHETVPPTQAVSDSSLV